MDLKAKRAMMVTMDRFKVFAIAGVCLGLALSGCGRKAALDTPTAASEPAPETSEITAAPVTPAPQPASSGFILNPLIGR